MTMEQAAGHIGMHRTGLYYSVKADRFDIPYVKVGSRYYFVPHKIMGWYEQNAHRLKSGLLKKRRR